MEQIPRLGGVGEVVKVKNGFARNFLLPRKRALRATKANREYFERNRQEIEKRNKKTVDEAQVLQKSLEGRELLAVRKASESGRLYGSVTPKDISAMLGEEGVQRSQIVLTKPIRELGIHPFLVRLHARVEATLLLNVARSEDEAKSQMAKYKAPAMPPKAKETKSPESKEKTEGETEKAVAKPPEDETESTAEEKAEEKNAKRG